jgi:succinate dehydrogenase hydrophobic anchor subunit
MIIGPKFLVFTGIIAVACSTAIVVFMLTSKNSAQETMQSQNFAKVYLEIDRLKKDCGK